MTTLTWAVSASQLPHPNRGNSEGSSQNCHEEQMYDVLAAKETG